MASTYMNDFRQRRYSERDAAVSSETSACTQEVEKMQRCIKRPAGFTKYLKISMIIGGIAGIALCFAIGFYGLLVGLIIGIVLDIVIMSIWNNRNEINAAKIMILQDDRKKQCKERCLMYNQTCDREIAQEEKRYKDRVSKARKTYGGSTVIDPVIKFVADDFEVRIRAAVRAAHVSQIVAECFFRADETELCIFEKLPHSGQNFAAKRYDYYFNRFYNLPDFFDRIGFAQALSKRVEFEILRRFPTDPIAPSNGFKPKIEIDYDDTVMHLTYKVQNPNYRAAVHLRTGIGS